MSKAGIHGLQVITVMDYLTNMIYLTKKQVIGINALKNSIKKNTQKRSKEEPHHQDKYRWHCPVMYDWFHATARKDKCNLCDGFLGDKSHRKYQKEETGVDLYAKFNKTSYTLKEEL
jgi:hypothetical protein